MGPEIVFDIDCPDFLAIVQRDNARADAIDNSRRLIAQRRHDAKRYKPAPRLSAYAGFAVKTKVEP